MSTLDQKLAVLQNYAACDVSPSRQDGEMLTAARSPMPCSKSRNYRPGQPLEQDIFQI